MTTRIILWTVRIFSLLALGSAIFILFHTSPYAGQDPSQKNLLNIVLLLGCLFLALSGIFGLFLFWLRKKAYQGEMLMVHLGVSLRQGILVGLCAIIILVLQSFRILTWWDGLLAVGAVMMVELYFLSR